jgi:hypothetical protein
MAGGLPFHPAAQLTRTADAGRISGSANGFLPRRSGLINGGTSNPIEVPNTIKELSNNTGMIDAARLTR